MATVIFIKEGRQNPSAMSAVINYCQQKYKTYDSKSKRNYSEQQKIVYLHKRNFEISNSRHADEKSTNWSHAMLSRGTKNAS